MAAALNKSGELTFIRQRQIIIRPRHMPLKSRGYACNPYRGHGVAETKKLNGYRSAQQSGLRSFLL